MPKHAMRPIICREVGCGYTYKHKQMDSKGWKTERLIHVASGECACRVTAFKQAQMEAGDKWGDLEDVMRPVLSRLEKLELAHYELVRRVEKRIESRKSRKHFKERDAKPKPWPMGNCVPYLLEQGLPVADKFREIMTVDRDPAWTWELALAAWFHWLLDQSPSDPVLMLYGGEIRFWDSNKSKTKTTKLRYFRTMAAHVKNWDHLDEATDAFFIGFYFTMIAACRKLCHWTNRILFDLPCPERAKDEFDKKVFADTPYMMAPDLQFQARISRCFHDVLDQRMDARKQNDSE